MHIFAGFESPCNTVECWRKEHVTVFFWVAGICICVLIVLLCHCAKGRPDKDNATFVKSDAMQQPQEMCETSRNVSQMQSVVVASANVFRSGIWTSRYHQYGKWHGPHEITLTFNPRSSKVSGDGWDEVGRFIVNGIYSLRTRRMGLTKTYQVDTGNKAQNLGHSVTIQLTENVHLQQFEGRWYGQTVKYHGKDKFVLSFNRSFGCEVV